MADETFETMDKAKALSDTVDNLDQRTTSLSTTANGFARAMSAAFTQATVGGKQFDDVLKGLALRFSNMALQAAFKPVAQGLAGGFEAMFSGLFGGLGGGGIGDTANKLKAAMGAIKPFASGGVIGTPTYFPLSGGGVGLAGEAGPEAIMPLQRGSDGRLGVAMAGGAAASINVHIATPDAGSFRRSETYVAGQIARAVARGQRSL